MESTQLSHFGALMRLFVLVPLLAGSVLASTMFQQGAFSHDDQVALFSLQIPVDDVITIRTWSFAGRNPDVLAGGFTPIIGLFDAAGSLLQIASPADTPPCGSRAADPATGACWDAFLSVFLTAGSYTVSLTEDDNYPLGPSLADAFARDGQGDFTGPEFTGSPGSFIMAGGFQRTSSYYIEVQNASSFDLPVPEPSTMLPVVLASAVGAFIFTRRRRRS